MKWFSNLKIAHKLALGFGLCLALSLAMGLTSISRMALMNNNTSLLNNDTVAGVSNIAELYNDVKQYRIFQFRYLLTTDRTGIDDLEGKMTDKATEVNKDIADYDKSASQDEDKKNVQELKKQWDSYLELTPALLGSVHTNDFKGASKEMLGEGLNRFNLVTDQLDRMNIWNSKHGEKLANEAESAYLNARSVTLVMLLLAIAFGIVSAMAVTRSITVPLLAVSNKLDLLRTSCATNLRAAMDALAQGDMTVAVIPTSTPLTIDAKDECGDLARAFNGLLDQVKGAVLAYQSARDALSTLLAQATNTANNIAQAADEIATGNTDLSQRTEEQASSLEETASSMEQMTATVKQNADNARQANQLAAQARDVAQSGGEVVANAVCAMAQINEGSTRIADIVGVIDEIAFQTNLLALNAAVEAARVGEQGRGFAVVAAEVRSLAGRSATAAKEIKALVTESVSQVQAGSTLVNQSGERLGEIVSSVKKVAQIIAEISAASVEQASGIDQVNRAVMQMDQITQQNAALVEEAAAASSSMASQAQGLQGLVSRFQVEGKYLQTVQQSVQATGTYGGGGGSHRARGASRRASSSSSSPSLTLVKAGNGGNGDAHADFEEF